MQLGFVSAILPELSGKEVIQFAAESGFDCVEVMCWPKGKAERRYAGVTHIDVGNFSAADAAEVDGWLREQGVTISGLGYYPNPLTPDQAEAQVYIDHIKKVILAAELLEIGVVNTFIGRDWHKSIDDNWPRFLEVWRPLIAYAEAHGIHIGIENCPMAFTDDEWPGGKNLAISPTVWRRMFNDIPSDNFGLNFDPSHLVWQQIDIGQAIREFAGKFVHVHAKDVRVDKHRLYEVGILGTPLQYHTPKLPGLGDVDWGQFYSHLSDAGYDGPVCIEVEDRAYEGSLERRKVSLVQSGRYLRQLMG
ncbi:MAG: sugar phosphate isomerase/epimerase [Chloroflexi bacterium]|nr:sugar phosphate isomerase/epimerase [Chloroflexota bacterium]